MDDVKVNTHNISNRVSLLDNKMAEVRDGMNNVQQVRDPFGMPPDWWIS